MNNIKQFIKESMAVVFLRTIIQQLLEALFVFRYVTDGNMSNNPKKLQAEISITIHALEKGMSIGEGRIGFGKKKAIAAIAKLRRLASISGDFSFIKESVGTIKDYVDYNESKGADMSAVKKNLTALIEETDINCQPRKGLLFINEDVLNKCINADFNAFSLSRHSIRDFSDKPIDKEKIRNALKLCERTPSACNRQSWKVHVFYDEHKRNKVFELQGGSKGFYNKMQCAVLICADLHYYNVSELNLAYVDGGLYGMNMLYALHNQGLATIPLTMGIKQGILNYIKKEMGIPKYEAPILLIGVGTYKKDFKVAYSHRIPYNTYTCFDS